MHSKNKVLLIRVPNEFKHHTNNGTPITEGYFLASLINQNIEAKIIDGFTYNNKEKLISKIKEENPKIIGFSTYDSNIELVKQISQEIKKESPNTITIIGGPQAVFMPSKAISKLKYIDIIARGDGEIQLIQIIKELNENKKLNELKTKGLTILYNNRIINTSKYERQKFELDQFKSPYLSNVFSNEKYRFAHIFFSRGCNFNCSFCQTSKAFKGVSYHSIKRVIEELKYVKKNRYQEVMFVDPAFFANKEKTKKLLREMIKEKINIPFWCESRFDEVDEESIKLLKKANVRTIAFGLESINEEILKKVNKQNSKNKILKTLEWCKKYGVETELMFIYGLPNETFQDAFKTINFLEENKIPIKKNSSGQQLRIFFGTEIYNNPEKFGIMFEKNNDYINPGINYKNKTFPKSKLQMFEFTLNKKRIKTSEKNKISN